MQGLAMLTDDVHGADLVSLLVAGRPVNCATCTVYNWYWVYQMNKEGIGATRSTVNCSVNLTELNHFGYRVHERR